MIKVYMLYILIILITDLTHPSTPEMTLKKYVRFIKNEKKQRATFLTNDLNL